MHAPSEEERHHGKHSLSSDCNCGGGSCPARCSERPSFLEQRKDRPLKHHRGFSRAMGPGVLFRRRSQRARQDVFEDRRLGARTRVESHEVAHAHPAARR